MYKRDIIMNKRSLELKFNTKQLEQLKDISYYNHLYYKLVYPVFGCEVIKITYDDDSTYCSCEFGCLVNNKFVMNYYFTDGDHNLETEEHSFYLDSDFC